MLTATTRIGKKNTLYLPKQIVKALKLEDGQKVELVVEGRSIRMVMIGDPLRLALEGKKFAKISPDEVEAISLEEQAMYARDSS